ncbi:MAG: tRNA adenosine(34) deaminase TadA [Arachnia propionica]|uniref:tRNA adenosine(34) deaminase TadA n=1 Tax=Arachnia propionica TaxID=1750 RepID=UPI0026F5D6A2|nr:tRNA adenosine(34) deaminase TadA [Arachnia propionica]
MRAALAAAREAAAHGDIPVGAVVLGPDGEVIAVGGNERELTGDPTAHAEVVALRRAAEVHGEWRLVDCTLVVTLEPCTMCAGAAVASRIGHVVFGAFDEKAGAVASLFDVVRDPRLNHRPRITSGVLVKECESLLLEFFEGRR